MNKKDRQKKRERSQRHAARFGKTKESRNKASAAPAKPRATIGDALDAATVNKLSILKATLEKHARIAVQHQLARPKTPWANYKLPKSAPALSITPPPSRVVAPSRAPTTSRAPTPSRAPKEKASATKAGIKSQNSEDVHWRNKITPRVFHAPKAPEKIKHYPRSKTPAVKEDDFKFWDLPAGAKSREAIPTKIPAEERTEFEKILSLANIGSDANDSNPVFATIGLDFGTSTTKAIVRLPFEPGEPTFAIPMPSFCRSDKNPHLWQTVVWVSPSGKFSPYPSPNMQPKATLKQDLMNYARRIHVGGVNPASGIAVEEAATAYLAYAIKYIKGRMASDHPGVFLGRSPVWFLNVGMATAGYDNKDLLRLYRHVCSAALLLANSDDEITADSTRSYLDNPTVSACAKDVKKAQELGIAVIPETAAEATGFTKSLTSTPGLYAMIDVGAMTLDACTFGLTRDEGEEDKLPLFFADVKPLGVEAYHWFANDGKDDASFAEQCNRMLWRVIWTTRTKRHRSADCWKAGNELSIFLTGGGANHDLHREVVEALGPWLSQFASNAGVRILSLNPPNSIESPVSVKDFGRLAVAWGLSYPPTEIGKPIPPSVIADHEKVTPIDFSQHFVSKDQV